MFFIAATVLACWLRVRGRLFEKRWLMWVFVLAVIPAFAGNESGWVAAEVGRQPWIVYPSLERTTEGSPKLDEAGQFVYDESQGLRTSDGVSAAVSAGQVLGSIIMFAAIYILLFVIWIYVLHQKISHGPEPVLAESDSTQRGGALAAASSWMEHHDSLTDSQE
nr:cytochrome ubiquinol oxidase subunit I [Bythopirellula polymerisocia]